MKNQISANLHTSTSEIDKFLKWFKFKYARKLNVDNFEFLNKGSFGYIISISESLVLKIEKLRTASDTIQKFKYVEFLKNNPITGVVTILANYLLPQEMFGSVYVITVMEKVDGTSNLVRQARQQMKDISFFANSAIQDKFPKFTPKFANRPLFDIFLILKETNTTTFRSCIGESEYRIYFEELQPIADNLFTIIENLYAANIFWKDVRPEQFCLDKDGNLVAVDVDDIDYF